MHVHFMHACKRTSLVLKFKRKNFKENFDVYEQPLKILHGWMREICIVIATEKTKWKSVNINID